MKIQILNRAMADVLWQDRLRSAGYSVIAGPSESLRCTRFTVRLGRDEPVVFDQPRLGVGKPLELSIFQSELGRLLVAVGVARMLDVRTPAHPPAAASGMPEEVRAMVVSLMAGSLGQGRKLTSWEAAPLVESAAVERAFPVLAHLPCYDVEAVYGRPWLPRDGPTVVPFLDSCDAPPVFILEAGAQGSFLVNTEGHGYARHVCRLMRASVSRDASLPRMSGGVA